MFSSAVLLLMKTVSFNDKNKMVIAILLTIVFARSAMGQDGEGSAYDSIWDRVVFYDDSHNNALK